MHVAYVSTKNDAHVNNAITEQFGEVSYFPTIKAALDSHNTFDTFVIDEKSPEKLFRKAQALRKSKAYYLTPLLVTEKKHRQPYIDSHLDNKDENLKLLESVAKHSQELETDVDDWRARFLQYCYTRPHKHISPEKSWHFTSYYLYSLIKVFNADDEDYELWLNDLIDQGVFKKTKLIDKLFTCASCASAHLKLQERCPHCNSINVKNDAFYHCFTCGNVAPEDDFLKKDELVCPKCHTRLRHIGEDYDKSLDTGVCLDCDNYFTEGKASLTCMICKKDFEPDDLTEQKIYELSITKGGLKVAKHYSSEAMLSIFDDINNLKPAYFYKSLDWMIGLQKRYKEEFFSIIGIYFSHAKNEAYSNIIETFAKNLKKTIRTTDLVTRLNDYYLWIVLPKTDKKGAEVVLSRIMKIDPDLAPEKTLSSVLISSTELKLEDNTAEKIISELSHKL